MGRKDDKTRAEFRDSCCGEDPEETVGAKRFGVDARTGWVAAVLRPYIGQVLEFAQSYGHRPCGSADGWWQAADDAHH